MQKQCPIIIILSSIVMQNANFVLLNFQISTPNFLLKRNKSFWMNVKNQRQCHTVSASQEKNSNPPLLQLLDGNKQRLNNHIQIETNSHIQRTELLDAGLTKKGMLVRVRLTRKMAKKMGRDFINGMKITSTGKISYNGKEFNKVSPLAGEINNTSLNGWDYVQVKKNEQWIFLKELRETYKQNSA